MTDFPVRIRPEIAALPAYQRGRQAGAEAFKLSSNENPFDPQARGWSRPSAPARSTGTPTRRRLRLRARLAERYGVADDAVHVAAGSVSILYQLAQATSGPGDEILFSWRSFEAYPGLATVAGARAATVPNDAAGGHDLDAMADAVTDRTRMIIVCSPNNPTGPVVTQDAFDAFLARVPGDVLVVLDEAYAEFVTQPGAVDGRRVVATGHPNVVVLRTFSKAYGLAGLRVGYAVGDPRILSAARTTGIPLSVTAAAEEAALASLDAEDELLERVGVIAQRRDRLAARLREAGWDVPEAQGNFVWLPAGDRALEVAAAFEAQDLIVRPFAGDGVRITVGEEESLDRVVDVAASVAPR
ncbi:histidinol-phosphate transaminase [Microbacterium aurum]